MTAGLVYVAGPITGDPFGCVRQAVAYFEPLRELGAVPFFPQLSVLHEMVKPVGYEAWMAYDFDVIRLASALLRLPGESPGADREVIFAVEHGVPVVIAGELAPDGDRAWAEELRRVLAR